MILKQYSLFLLASACLLASCSNAPNPATDSTNDTTAAVAADTTPPNAYSEYLFQYTLLNLPPPMQILSEFSKSNMPVNVALLNTADNANKYKTATKQALNYGIYGMDLGYLVVNNRILDIKKYYSTTQKLAADLNMSESFNAYTARFEKNSENKDSLSRLVDEALMATDNYLRTNERLETASQALAGSWLECQYITVNLLKEQERTAENENLYQRVWEQRLYLDKITELLGTFKDNKEMTSVVNEYNQLLAIYKEPSDSKQITKDYLDKLAKKLNSVRNSIIN
ncbi:MAG: hypothetical protein JNK61_08570 [Bacteroidia bacterium]|nr:hypothetical protein [Bacteroidia bacterium]